MTKLGFKVFYDCIVKLCNTYTVVSVCIAKLHLWCSFAIHTFTTGTSTHDPDAATQDIGHWGRIVLHTARVFLDPFRGVCFV